MITTGNSAEEWVSSNFWDLKFYAGEWFLGEEIVVLDGLFYDREEVSFCDQCESYYVDDGEGCCDSDSSNENPYAINDYHCSPTPTFYRKGNLDFCLGFEVEKTAVGGNDCEGETVEYQPLFAGWETDSSCGVEGITNVYSIDDFELFSQHVDKSDYCNDPCNASCGGHVNMSGNGLTLEKVRPYAGLFYALYRYRLNNSYSNKDKGMHKTGERYAAIRETVSYTHLTLPTSHNG